MTLVCCYDLMVNPPSYDVVAFLAHAELARIESGCEQIDMHILPGPAGGFRKDNLWPHSIGERVQLRNKVVEPMCWCLPSVKSVQADFNRSVNGWGVRERHISLPAIMAALKAGCRPLRPAVNRPRVPGLITFTLRETEHHPARNSRTDEWVRAAKFLNDRGHEVVIVRDTAKASEDIEGIRCEPDAAFNLSNRASLYASAALNVGVCNGPMWFAIFLDVPVLMLRPVTDGIRGCYDTAFYKRYGLNSGDQLPTSPSYQRLVWEGDDWETIVRNVEEMLACVG